MGIAPVPSRRCFALMGARLPRVRVGAWLCSGRRRPAAQQAPITRRVLQPPHVAALAALCEPLPMPLAPLPACTPACLQAGWRSGLRPCTSSTPATRRRRGRWLLRKGPGGEARTRSRDRCRLPRAGRRELGLAALAASPRRRQRPHAPPPPSLQHQPQATTLFTMDLGAPEDLPDALRGEKWSFVQLPLATLQQARGRGGGGGRGVRLPLAALQQACAAGAAECAAGAAGPQGMHMRSGRQIADCETRGPLPVASTPSPPHRCHPATLAPAGAGRCGGGQVLWRHAGPGGRAAAGAGPRHPRPGRGCVQVRARSLAGAHCVLSAPCGAPCYLVRGLPGPRRSPAAAPLPAAPPARPTNLRLLPSVPQPPRRPAGGLDQRPGPGGGGGRHRPRVPDPGDRLQPALAVRRVPAHAGDHGGGAGLGAGQAGGRVRAPFVCVCVCVCVWLGTWWQAGRRAAGRLQGREARRAACRATARSAHAIFTWHARVPALPAPPLATGRARLTHALPHTRTPTPALPAAAFTSWR